MTQGKHGKKRWFWIGGVIVVLVVAGGIYYKLTPHGALAYYDDGESLLKKGDVPSALIQFRNAVQKQPENGKMRLALGQTLLLAGDPISAEKELKAAERLGIASAKVTMPLARAYLSQAKYEEVLKSVPDSSGTPAERVQSLLLRGEADLGLRKFSEATAAFEAALKINANEPRAYVGLARVAIGQGKVADAAAPLDQALKLAPKDAEALALKGETLRLGGHVDQALTYYDKALAVDPHQILGHIGRAVALIDRGKLDEAGKDVAAVLKVSPHHPIGNYLDALLLARQKKPGDAIDVLEREQNALTYPPSLLLLATLQYHQKHVQQAQTNLQNYLRLVPGNTRARTLLGRILLEQGLAGQAVQTLLPGASANPPDPELLAALGNAYLRDHQPSKALNAFDQAAAAAPNDARTRTEVAVGRLRVGQSAEALKDLDAAIKTDPKDLSARVLVVLTHLHRKELAQAETAAESLKAAAPKNPISYNLLGAVAVARTDNEAARANFNQALALQPHFTPARANLAELDAKAGKLDQAATDYKDILSYDPKNLDALNGLANLSFAQHKVADGIAWLKKARDNNPNALAPRLRLVAVYLAQHQAGQALTEAQELQVTAPNQPSALDALGQAQLASGKVQDAITTFRQLTVVLPKSAPAQQRLASALFVAKDTAGARQALETALQIDPTYATAEADLIEMKLVSGDKKGAVQQAEEWRTKHPDLANVDVLVGDTEFKAGMPAAAAADYALGMAKQPSSALVVRQAEAQSAAGNVAGAIHTLKSWLAQHKEDAAARMALAGYHLSQRDYRAAEAEYQALDKQVPNNPAVLNNLAWVYGQLGNEKAIPYAEKAYKLAPKSPEVADTLGYLQVQKGDKAKGVTLLEAAHKAAPENSSIAYHLAVGLSETGQAKEARALLKEALGNAKPFADEAAAKALYAKLGGQ